MPVIVQQDATVCGLFISVTATCRERDWMGTGSNAVTVLLMPDAVDTVPCAPDYGWRCHPKHVEWFTDINKPYIVGCCWTFIGIYEERNGPGPI